MRFLSLFFISLTLMSCQKNRAQKEIDFDKSFQIKTTANEEEILVEVLLAKGVHAYASGETVGVPVKLIINPSALFTVEEIIYPKGHVKNLAGSNESIILTDSFAIKAKIKKDDNLQGQKLSGQGELLLQLCSETSCDRPKNHAISF